MTTAEIIKIATRNCSGVTSAKEWVFTEEEILWFVNELSTAERLNNNAGLGNAGGELDPMKNLVSAVEAHNKFYGTDQTNKMAEERYPYKPGELSCVPFQREAWASGYTEGLKAGGWVKVDSEKDLPGEKWFGMYKSDTITGRSWTTGTKANVVHEVKSGRWVQWFNEALLPEQRRPIDTLRQWMATGYNIEQAANSLLSIVLDGNEKGEPYNDIQTKVYKYICTEMFKGIELSPPLPDEQEIAGKAWDACRTFCIEWFACAISPDITETPTTPNREQYLRSIKKEGV